MHCDIYNSVKNSKTFVFVTHGNDPHNVLPENIIKKLGGLQLLKNNKEINENGSLIGASPKEIITDINGNGYSIQGAEIKNSISDVGAAVGAGILTASLGAPILISASVAVLGFGLAHWLMSEDEDNEEGGKQ